MITQPVVLGKPSEPTSDRVRDLEKEVMDLRIPDAGKDFWIGRLREEQDCFLKQLVERSHRIGELESELRRLTAGRPRPEDRFPGGFEHSHETRTGA